MEELIRYLIIIFYIFLIPREEEFKRIQESISIRHTGKKYFIAGIIFDRYKEQGCCVL